VAIDRRFQRGWAEWVKSDKNGHDPILPACIAVFLLLAIATLSNAMNARLCRTVDIDGDPARFRPLPSETPRLTLSDFFTPVVKALAHRTLKPLI
jgi:hypothetical protein